MSAPPPRWLSSARGRRFRSPEIIGSGAGGTVYRLFDQERNAVIAVKALRNPTADSIAGLKREFRALARFDHPNVLQLHELLCWDSEWLLTMEYIDGINFLEWVRPGYQLRRSDTRDPEGNAAPDPSPTGSGSSPFVNIDTGTLEESRLRDALGQLALGLDAVHRSGRLHRDIKPSNVLVTRGGRVVVCDFGLVTDLRSASQGSAVLGTPSYMSPEQAAGAPLGTPSDLYGVGVMLYEALAGMRPFAGDSEEIMLRKQRVIPVPPSELTQAPVPPDLEQLAMRLLAIDPALRPSAREVRSVLGDTSVATPLLTSVPLLAREAPMAALRAALDHVARSGRGHSVLLQGPRGVGKSAVLRQFADEVQSGEQANVLIGACYEHEFVPHRALDEVMDGLVSYLRSSDVDVASEFTPQEVQSLLALFPMLARALAPDPNARITAPSSLDPRELRRSALDALRRLVHAAGRNRPWLVIVDDLQWGDEESLPILSALLGHPSAPPMLFVGGIEVSDTLTDNAPIYHEMLRRPEAFGGVTRMPLEPLSMEDTRRLASSWLGDGVHDEWAAEIAARAQGLPAQVRKLAEHLESTPRSHEGFGERPVVDVLQARIDVLRGSARQLLEVVSLATHRETLSVLLSALGGVPDEAQALALLRRQELVRTLPAGRGLRLDVNEDRVRVLVRGALAPERRAALHLALLEAVRAERPDDHETQLFHARAAGLHELAAQLALMAANSARASLRFERAARFAQMAVQLLPHESVTFEHRRGLAEALALAGRGAEAGRAYVRAADSAPTTALAHECRRIGAGHLLRSGYLEEGEAAMNAQLTLLGAELLDIPNSLVSRVVAAAAERSRRVLGEVRPNVENVELLTELVDTHWEAVTGLALIDPTRAGWLQLRHQRYARRLNEPRRMARSVWAEAFMTGLRGKAARGDVDALFARASSITPVDAESQARAATLLPLLRGILSTAAGEYPVGRGQLARALRTARERGRAQAWELAVAETYMLWAMVQLGELRAMSTRIQGLLSDAEPRADRFFETTLTTGTCALAKLGEGDAAEVLRRADRVRAVWDRASAPLPHALADLATLYAHLYEGDAEQAERCVHATLGPDVPGSHLGIEHLDVELSMGRALAALAVARLGQRPLRARQALALTERIAGGIRADTRPAHHVLAKLLDGLVLIEKRREPDAMVALHEAESELRRRGMATLATVTRAAHGVALGGDAGREFVQQARHDLRAFGVRHPDAFLGIWVGLLRTE